MGSIRSLALFSIIAFLAPGLALADGFIPHQHDDYPQSNYSNSYVASSSPKNKFYYRIQGGVGISAIDIDGIDDDYNIKNYTGGVGIGYQLNDRLRSDITLTYTSYIKKANITSFPLTVDPKEISYTALWNLYYDFFKVRDKVSNYAMWGVGISKNELIMGIADSNAPAKNVKTKSHSTRAAFQGGVGIMYKLMDCLDLDIGYRLVFNGNTKYNVPDAVGDATLVKSNLNHNIIAGLNFKF